MDQHPFHPTCPQCRATLLFDAIGILRQGSTISCDACQQALTLACVCPDCQAVIAPIRACGTVSYFCDTCNELKSKSRILFSLQTD